MQQFPTESIHGASSDSCAALMLEIVPAVMRTIRTQMRLHTSQDLSVVHFRTLAYLHRQQGAGLSGIAEHIGLTLPAASKIVQSLFVRGYLTRRVHGKDRRKNILTPTAKGTKTLLKARRATQHHLAAQLGNFRSRDRQTLAHAMRLLQPIFVTATTTEK